ncbi:uncharacterized protein LOC141648405 [Silene latifolia]|uniref:uncharacterized protein LOC141648405 n=1 Tax=Silene latifolia TaxID=37657 RepID=UPI003D77DF7A
MKAIRGNTSNLTAFSKLLKSFTNLSESHQINSHESSHLLKIRVFSSFNGRRNDRNDFNRGRNDFNGGRNDFNRGRNDNDNDDKFSGRDRGNHGYNPNAGIPARGDRQRPQFGGQNMGPDRDNQPRDNHGYNPNAGRPARGDRQRPQFGGQNMGPDRDNEPRDNRPRGRRNDGFSRPVGGDRNMDRERDRANLKLSDDFFKLDENDEVEGKKDYQPSVRELVNKRGEKEDGEFLEKFKLGGVGKEESRSDEVHRIPPPEEEKMEVPEEANEIFNKMRKNGLIPNAVAMLDGLCKDGLVHEAMKLFGVMREKGSMPEVVVYTAVVEGFCKAHKVDDAVRIFKKMQDNGIVPNAFSYSVLVNGLCKAKRLEEAFDLCAEMLEAGHSPNVATFTELVHEFCKEKGVEDAQRFIEMLKQKGFCLDEKVVRVHLDKTGPTSPMVREAIFGPKKTTESAV